MSHRRQHVTGRKGKGTHNTFLIPGKKLPAKAEVTDGGGWLFFWFLIILFAALLAALLTR